VLQKENDPRLDKIRQNVYRGTVLNIILGLEKQNLAEKIPEDNDYKLCGELTQEAFNQITDATSVAIDYIFKHARINLVSYKFFDEKKIANALVEQAGLPIIRCQPLQNSIDIEFIGTQPLVKKINSYLNPEKCKAEHVRNIEINKIALIFETRDHLN